MDRFQDIESLLRAILVVALSEEIGTNNGDELLPSEVFLRATNSKIKGFVFEEPVEIIDDSVFNTELMDDDDKAENWIHWARSLHKEAENIASASLNGDTVNAFYIPQVALR